MPPMMQQFRIFAMLFPLSVVSTPEGAVRDAVSMMQISTIRSKALDEIVEAASEAVSDASSPLQALTNEEKSKMQTILATLAIVQNNVTAKEEALSGKIALANQDLNNYEEAVKIASDDVDILLKAVPSKNQGAPFYKAYADKMQLASWMVSNKDLICSTVDQVVTNISALTAQLNATVKSGLPSKFEAIDDKTAKAVETLRASNESFRTVVEAYFKSVVVLQETLNQLNGLNKQIVAEKRRLGDEDKAQSIEVRKATQAVVDAHQALIDAREIVINKSANASRQQAEWIVASYANESAEFFKAATKDLARQQIQLKSSCDNATARSVLAANDAETLLRLSDQANTSYDKANSLIAIANETQNLAVQMRNDQQAAIVKLGQKVPSTTVPYIEGSQMALLLFLVAILCCCLCALKAKPDV